MRSTQAYSEITGHPVTPKVLDWLHDLEEKFGDTAVVRVMEDVASSGKLTRFLNVVSDRLHSEAAMRRAARQPTELDHDTLMALVRGEIALPELPFIYDAGRLTRAEYGEVLAWAVERLRGKADGVPA